MVSMLTGLGTFVCDQFVKSKVENGSLAEGKTFFKDVVQIKPSTNKGFVMNKGEDKPKIVLVVCSIVFGMALLMYLGTLGKKHKGVKRFGLGLVLGGAASNLYDRVKKDGVTDYVSIKGDERCIFNIGDVAVCLGSIIAAIGEIFSDDE